LADQQGSSGENHDDKARPLQAAVLLFQLLKPFMHRRFHVTLHVTMSISSQEPAISYQLSAVTSRLMYASEFLLTADG
jgi:hypothetical protein